MGNESKNESHDKYLPSVGINSVNLVYKQNKIGKHSLQSVNSIQPEPSMVKHKKICILYRVYSFMWIKRWVQLIPCVHWAVLVSLPTFGSLQWRNTINDIAINVLLNIQLIH